jgi:hypothetical protein
LQSLLPLDLARSGENITIFQEIHKNDALCGIMKVSKAMVRNNP